MTTKLLIILFLLSGLNYAYSQCDSVTVKSVTNFTPFVIDSLFESDGIRNGPDYRGATIYYPKKNNKKLKSIIFVPGFQATQSSVKYWAKYLAERGFLSMTIGTNSLSDPPELRAKALIDAMETIRSENIRESSPLFDRIDTSSIAVGGWSMGGGGAQLAAVIEPEIKAVIALAPWLNYVTLSNYDLIHSVPLLIISSEFDIIAPPALNANIHYDYTPENTEKLILEIADGNHYTPLYPSEDNGNLGNVGYVWLKLFLDDNDCYCKLLNNDSLINESFYSKFETNIDCSYLSVSYNSYSNIDLKVFPNPSLDYIVLEFNSKDEKFFSIYNINGNKIKHGKTHSSELINISILPVGKYFLKIENSVINIIKE